MSEEQWKHFCDWYQPPSDIYCSFFASIQFPSKSLFEKALAQCSKRFAEKFPGDIFEPVNSIDCEELRDRLLFLSGADPVGYIFSPVKRFGPGNLWIYVKKHDGSWIDRETAPISTTAKQ